MILFPPFFLLKGTCLYSWAWKSPRLPKWAERMELEHHQEVLRTASFLPHSPQLLHGMNSLTVLTLTLGNKCGPAKSNTHFPLFTSLWTLYPRYSTSTAWFLIDTVLERMPLLCSIFLSQKSHIFTWDFLSQYLNAKLYHKQNRTTKNTFIPP